MGSKIPKIDPRMRQIGTSGVHFQNDDQGAPGVLNLQRTSISNYHQSYGTFSPTSWALRGLQLHACYRLTSRGETPRTRAVRSTRTRPRTGSLRVSTVVKVTHRERTSAYLHVLQHLSPPVTTCRVHGLRKNQLCRHTAHHTGSDRQKMITPSSSIDIPILCRNYRQVVHRRTYRRNRRY